MSSGRIASAAKRRKKIASIDDSRQRLRNSGLLADIIEDGLAPLYFCVVQEQGSVEVLFLGQYPTRSAATDAAVQFMSEYLNREEAA